jgi:hypothetical protein
MAIVSFMSATKLAELLDDASKPQNMYVRVANNRILLGADPLNPTFVVNLSKEAVESYGNSAITKAEVPLSRPDAEAQSLNENTSRLPRRTGHYWFELKGRRIGCKSLKELLATALRHIEHLTPGMLENLTNIKLRSKRIVARDRNHLFDREHLAKDYSERLMPGWWYGTNNSAKETEAWLRRACGAGGLKWDDDFKASF